MLMRCKKCRCTLLTDFAAAADDEPLRKREEEESKGPAVIMVVNCHGGRVIPTAEICEELVVSNTCLALEDKSIIYIKEDSLPLWIDTRVQMAGWTKGKILCPNDSCAARLGSFDFLSGQKCDCNEFVLPPVRLTSSKVDVIISNAIKSSSTIFKIPSTTAAAALSTVVDE